MQIPHHAEREHATPNSAWAPVLIRADPVGAFAAARMLSKEISGNIDDVVLEVPIHRSRHSAIIGRKGLTIAGLSSDHAVRIMVPNRNAGQLLADMMALDRRRGGTTAGARRRRGEEQSCQEWGRGDALLFLPRVRVRIQTQQ